MQLHSCFQFQDSLALWWLSANKYVDPPIIYPTVAAANHMFLTFNVYLPELHIGCGHNKFWRSKWSAFESIGPVEEYIQFQLGRECKTGGRGRRRSVHVMEHILRHCWSKLSGEGTS